mgnify:FL=1
MDNTRLISIENTDITYHQQRIFSNLNLEIRKNQHLAVVGESGSGKSALLRALDGQLPVLKGKIRHSEYDRLQNAPHEAPAAANRRRSVYVDIRHDFQPPAGAGRFYYQQRFNAGYADHAPTVAQYLAEKAQKASPDTPWTLERIYACLQLESMGRRHVIKLSSGESKRLRIAAALLQHPVLLLLDCPLAGLDEKTRQIFEDLFFQIADSGIWLVMATNPDQIPGVITHVAVPTPEQNLQVFQKNAFCASFGQSRFPGQADIRQLRTLMNNSARQRFNLVVGMKNVRVAYGSTVIFENINWQIRQGEHWALSGPNGSGKSTLLSLINGDHPQAYANDIVLFDRKRGSGESIWDIKKKTGFMSPELFQYFPLRYTCVDVVESGFYDTLGVLRKTIPQNRQKAEQWMNILGLSIFSGRYFSQLSAGKQRLCLLARALVKNPYLLLLDEPCQGLARSQQRAFQQLTETIAAISDITIVYVTHHAEQLPSCIQNTLHLPGRIS